VLQVTGIAATQIPLDTLFSLSLFFRMQNETSGFIQSHSSDLCMMTASHLSTKQDISMVYGVNM
jgi:hypothetical protein